MKDSQVPILFSDRSPLSSSAVMSDEVDLKILPWTRFRTRNFSEAGGKSEDLARYGAEVLIWLGLPLYYVSEFAVLNDRVASDLNTKLKSSGKPAVCKVRPAWFFNRA